MLCGLTPEVTGRGQGVFDIGIAFEGTLGGGEGIWSRCIFSRLSSFFQPAVSQGV